MPPSRLVVNMSMSFTEEFKDAKINQLLEDYNELEITINAIPKKLEDSLRIVKEAIELLPIQLDNNLKDKIQAIIEVSEQAEKNTKTAAENQAKEFSIHADAIKTEALASFKIALDNSLSLVMKELKEASNGVNKLTKEKKASPTPLVLVGILCALLSLGGGFLGTAIWNKSYLDNANAQVAYKDKVLNASLKGKDALIATLPPSLTKKANETYLKAADEELKK